MSKKEKSNIDTSVSNIPTITKKHLDIKNALNNLNPINIAKNQTYNLSNINIDLNDTIINDDINNENYNESRGIIIFKYNKNEYFCYYSACLWPQSFGNNFIQYIKYLNNYEFNLKAKILFEKNGINIYNNILNKYIKYITLFTNLKSISYIIFDYINVYKKINTNIILNKFIPYINIYDLFSLNKWPIKESNVFEIKNKININTIFEKCRWIYVLNIKKKKLQMYNRYFIYSIKIKDCLNIIKYNEPEYPFELFGYNSNCLYEDHSMNYKDKSKYEWTIKNIIKMKTLYNVSIKKI